MQPFTTFRYPLVIKEHHLDTFAHVNNAKYLELLEEARWEFLNAQGITLSSIQKIGVGPVVLECHIRFVQEITLRQSITIESQLMQYENKIGVMRQDIIDQQGALCSTATITFGLMDITKRKLILPTAQWLAAIGVNP